MSSLRWLGALAAGLIAVVVGLQVAVLRQEVAPPALTESPKPSVRLEGGLVEEAEATRAVESEPVPMRGETGLPSGEDVEEDVERLVAAEGTAEGAAPSLVAPAVPPEERPSGVQFSRKLEGRAAPPPTPPTEAEAVPRPAPPARAAQKTAPEERFEPLAERPEPQLAAAATGEETVVQEQEQEPQQVVRNEAQEAAAPAVVAADERQQIGRLRMAAVDRGDPVASYRALDRQYVRSSAGGLRETTELDKEDKASTADEIEAECNAWRAFLAEFPDSDQAIDARYRLAACSISLYDLRQTDDDRRQALDDGTSFLEASPGGERAEEIRRHLDRIRR
jgi:hypothetical protein